ncbi:MAG TPA: hypothetical protein VFD36_22925 [Kofleriaceae bacterium]|nr:hypothetical protein [Kofleriaceae bacterium]
MVISTIEFARNMLRDLVRRVVEPAQRRRYPTIAPVIGDLDQKTRDHRAEAPRSAAICADLALAR